MVSLLNAVLLTIGSCGTREPMGRMQGPAIRRSQTGMQSSQDTGVGGEEFQKLHKHQNQRILMLTPPFIFLRYVCENVPA